MCRTSKARGDARCGGPLDSSGRLAFLRLSTRVGSRIARPSISLSVEASLSLSFLRSGGRLSPPSWRAILLGLAAWFWRHHSVCPPVGRRLAGPMASWRSGRAPQTLYPPARLPPTSHRIRPRWSSPCACGSVSVCLCASAFVSVGFCVRSCVCVRVCMCLRMRACACVSVHPSASACVCAHLLAHACAFALECTCVHALSRACVRVRARACVCVIACTRTCLWVHVHVSTCMCALAFESMYVTL